jgi:hypothetical protein
MMREIRKHLSYANVMATIAMVLALGGATALAAGHLKKNTVTSKSIKNGAVKTADLKGSAVTGAKIADGAVGIGDVGASLHLQCKGGTQYLQGACIDNNPEGTTDWGHAQLDCQTKGGRLPNVSELMTLSARGVSFGGPRELTDVLTLEGANAFSETVFSGGKFIQFEDTDNATQYRCVFEPTG